jgi:hypothetical protein
MIPSAYVDVPINIWHMQMQIVHKTLRHNMGETHRISHFKSGQHTGKEAIKTLKALLRRGKQKQINEYLLQKNRKVYAIIKIDQKNNLQFL